MNLKEFANNKKELYANIELLNEAYKNEDFSKALNLIKSLLKKHTNYSKVLKLQPVNVFIDNKEYSSIMFCCTNNLQPEICFSLNFLVGEKNAEVYSISFFKNWDFLWRYENGKSELTIYTMGNSLVYFLPLIFEILNTQKFDISNKKFKEYAKHIFKESYSKKYIGAFGYNIYEGLNDDYIFEKTSERLKHFKKNMQQAKEEVYANRKNDPNEWKNLLSDYQELTKAIRGGATDLDDIDISFKSNVTVKLIEDSSMISAKSKLDKAKEEYDDPDTTWKEMEQYIKMVVKGIQPSLIVAGGPGIGKTYRIKKQLKAYNYKEGQNLWTIKGKCTPRQMYMALYNFQNKGDIVIVDDADAVIGPKAPEDVINILKAALDSTSDDEGRLVSYNVSGKLLDDDGTPIPKRFYYRGGIIVITNYRIGQLDTALRGRSYLLDINFSLESILEIIKDLLPELDKEMLSMQSKEKAYSFLKRIAPEYKDKIEISIRTFGICSKIFECAGEDFSDEECEKMILGQLLLQAERGGKKY